MANKLQKHQSKESLSWLDKIAEHVVLALITPIISLGLLGGGSYLLFQNNTELAKVDQALMEWEKWVAELDDFNDFMDISTTGYFAQESNWKKEQDISSIIENSVNEPKIDELWREEALNSVRNSILIITEERAKLKAFVFVKEREQLIQRSLSDAYGHHRSYLQVLYELILQWNDISPNARDEFFREIGDNLLQSIETMQLSTAALLQMKRETEISMRENNLKNQEILQKINSVKLKNGLALFGMILGSTVIGLSTWKYISLQLIKKRKAGSSSTEKR